MSLLNNIHLVITRPKEQAEAWAKQLVNLQLLTANQISQLALLEICPIEEGDDWHAIKTRVLDLDLYQKVIFVSQHAVSHAFRWFDTYWPQLPIAVEFLAIGKRTAQLLVDQGVSVSDLAASQHGAMTSEVLLASPLLENVDEQRILICRGKGGRPLLGDELSRRGARVDYCELYERRLPSSAAADWDVLSEKLAVSSCQILMTFHSGETFANFLESLQERESLAAELKQKAIIVVPSARVAEQVKSAGFEQLVQAANATDEAMQECLMNIGVKIK